MTTGQRRRGFSVRVFLPNGDPDGIKTIEKSNWTGAGLVIPRPLFPEARLRKEVDRAGVYMLIGPDETSQLSRVYVGEGDPVGPRLDDHAKKKDFWTHAVTFTSKDQNLNKAHVQHLESRLTEMAKVAKRCVLDNGNSPQLPSLSEADSAEVEGFLDDMLLCLPILGYGYFEVALAESPKSWALFLNVKGITACGFDLPQGFVVKAGSQAVKEESGFIHAYLKDLRLALLKEGILVDKGNVYEMTQDYSFTSPSTASGVLLGRSSNGRTEWQSKDGRTLKALQETALGQ